MSTSILVRASRDGDQFHYLWAARRALQLLTAQSGLVAITIEGASTFELQAAGAIEAGEELIDIAEYYGSTAIEKATLVRYMQLKHSTLRVDDVWQLSGLEKTITGFSERYATLRKRLPTEPLHEKLEFWFVTNRPISTDIIEAVEDAALHRAPRHPANLAKLKRFTSLEDVEFASFCRTLRFEGRQDDYWSQRNILFHDVSGYLPELDVDAPTRLKELITRKALSESSANPAITKIDVLRALRTDESDLFPAPCLIEQIDHAVVREQEPALIAAIAGAAGRPVIVHADAGVGKSIFSTRIGTRLPVGSVSILYDCFGNGQYRSATGYRHRHRTALVQIANELSALGLCHPLIPSTIADASVYMRAFMHRVTQSVSVLRARNADALLCIVVDAADNAQMAAEEINEPRSFVRDLLREKLPEGVRVVALCRPHREAMLDPPPDGLSLGLHAFNRAETAVYLRQQFPKATDHDVNEFHRLSSHNPRVQALALSRKAPLPEILRLLGPNPTTVEGTIGAILEASIARLRDEAGRLERDQVDLICTGLAALRPLVPISVLAAMSGLNQAAIRSFALDLGRPLIVTEHTIQFFDEPAETWFRERFRPDTTSVKKFVARLKAFSSSSAYVAAVLPQLMLEAGEFSELVELALASKGLPEGSPVKRRDVELQRLQFALKASLRSQRHSDAAKLALKAGGESAGDDRQQALLRDNIDLAAAFIDSNGVQELVSRRAFGSGWMGSHHAYEAAILSGHVELIGEARSRLRMAEEWLRSWSKLEQKERDREKVSDEDRAILAAAHFNIHGAAAAAYSLRIWRPRELSYRAGRILARRFLDHGRYRDLDELAVAADNDLGLILAIGVEARNLHRLLPKEVASRGLRLLCDRRIKVEDAASGAEPTLAALTSMVEIAYRLGLCDADSGKKLLERYLPETPPHGLSSRYSGLRPHYMRAYALRAAFDGTSLQLIDLANPDQRKEIEARKQYEESRDLQEFKEDIGELLPWYNLWARVFVGQMQKSQLNAAISGAISASAEVGRIRYREDTFTSDEIASLWADILLEAGCDDMPSMQAVLDWSKSLKRHLFTPTLNRLARLSGQTSGWKDLAFEFAQTAFLLLRDERSDAQSKATGYVDVARAILATSRSEAEAYFNEAVGVASRIGDENLARWDALIDLAERAARPDRSSPKVAYKFARCAEVTWDYVARDKHFPWSATVSALVGLCPSSSLAITSRWRDRGFGNEGRVLPLTIEALVARGSLSPLDALPLVGFRAEWNEVKLIEAVLSRCEGKDAKASALRFIYRYMTLETQRAAHWRHLEAAALSAGINLPGLKERIADSDAVEKAAQGDHTKYHGTTATEPKEDRNWNSVFSQCDLTASVEISLAYQRFRAGEPPFYSQVFFREAIERVPIGKEPEFVAALGGVAEFDLSHLRSFLEAFPEGWKGRLGIRASLGTMLKASCRRFCMAIRRSRYYEILPLKLMVELSGVEESEFFNLILTAIGESTELAGPDRLFSLVGLLSSKLTYDDALEVLSYGLDLFDVVLKGSDGDGPWAERLTPPAAMEDSLAGYIWAGLASPVAAVRWEAAHVVVALCGFGRTRIIAGLFHHAESGTTTPFGDGRFAFYSLHAHQWLLIAVARAALNYGTALIPHADRILAHADEDQPHVLIRLFAARTALTLNAQQLIALSADLQQRLLEINASPFEPIRQDRPSHHSSEDGTSIEDNETPKDDRYFFEMDFGSYWLAPLGRCFGVTQTEIERDTLKTVRSDLGFSGTNRWEDDKRARRGLYREEGTSYRHSSYPRIDDHGFYLSYHAMLITAGRLLATKPLVEYSSDWNDDRFSGWLARHDISRSDGRWLFDRRDPRPPGRPDWLESQKKSEWLSSIAAGDFERALYPDGAYMAVWGRWSDSDTSCEESVSVRTALVSPERSASLLRALQTAHNPHDFRIPDADDDLQIDEGPYQLRGWVVDRPSQRGLDECDRWAGDVRFPAPEPAAFVVEMMQLSTDSDRRVWLTASVPEPALRSEAWGHFPEKDSSERPNGCKLQASIKFVVEFLMAISMEMIVEVEIQRRLLYRRSNGNELHNVLPSTRLFIVRRDGTIRTL